MPEPANLVELNIDGRRHAGWTGVAVSRALDSLTGSFSLQVTRRERTEGDVRALRAGAGCTLLIDGETVISGMIDRLSIRLSRDQQDIVLTGRDRACDLVDCSAIARPGSWSNTRMESIVADLLKPFGLTARFTAPTGGPIRQFALQQGESVHSAIERLCRFRALVAWSAADGAILIGNPAAGAATGRLVEGLHLEELGIDHDVTERYSDYIVKGQARGDDDASGAAVARLRGDAADPAVGRYRPLIIIAEDQGDRASLATRARWEANVRAARGQTLSLTVPGWRDPAGALWRPETKVQVAAPTLSVDSAMLVVSAELLRDQDGTRTYLQLQRPEAWSQLAVPETATASAIGRAA